MASHRQICSLLLSTMLVFVIFSSAWAKKDHANDPQASQIITTVVETPHKISKKQKIQKKQKQQRSPKSYKKGYISSQGHVNKTYTQAQKRPHKKRDYYRNKHWKQWDREYGRSPWVYSHRPRYGSRQRALPKNHFNLFIGGVPFFYSAGVYFQSDSQGYVVVQPPLGGRVPILPERCSSFYSGDHRYYSCDDVFYEEVGAEYVVINKPSTYRIIADAGDEVAINTNTLNLRTGPGLGYDILTTLHQGEIAEVDEVDGEWYYVSLEDGSHGWIKRQYTRIINLKEDPKG